MLVLLVVDDEPNIVEGLASQFNKRYNNDVIVLRAFSGLNALSILQNNKVDVVLSDIRMPDMDGIALQREAETLWPRIHFVFLSGFDDFTYIHQASKSPLYHGYLLKSEGDEEVMNKIDAEIQACTEEARAELERGKMQQHYVEMEGVLRNVALEAYLRGGSWERLSQSVPALKDSLRIINPVVMVLGKSARIQKDDLQGLLLADGILASQISMMRYESFIPETGTFVWLFSGGGEALTANYLYAVFEDLQQQLSDTADYQVSIVVGNAVPFERLAEQYQWLNSIYKVANQGTERLIIVNENNYADLLGEADNKAVHDRLKFSELLQHLDQTVRYGSQDDVRALFDKETLPLLSVEQCLLLFSAILNLRHELLPDSSNYDEKSVELLNDCLRCNDLKLQKFVSRFTDLCVSVCAQRAEREEHSTQTIIDRVERYIDEHIEDYDLSLTTLARVVGFNPSYLSRFYRLNTGKKLSDQIDAAKLKHAKKLIANGELVKNVAERTGFASPSAFILFFKRNTGITPIQYYEQQTGERPRRNS